MEKSHPRPAQFQTPAFGAWATGIPCSDTRSWFASLNCSEPYLVLLWWTHRIFCKPWISDSTINEWFIWHSTRSKNTKEYCLFSIQFKVERLQIIVVAKKYIYVSQLFISRMPKMRAIPQLVSAPLNPIPIAEHFRRSHPPCEHSRGQHI